MNEALNFFVICYFLFPIFFFHHFLIPNFSFSVIFYLQFSISAEYRQMEKTVDFCHWWMEGAKLTSADFAPSGFPWVVCCVSLHIIYELFKPSSVMHHFHSICRNLLLILSFIFPYIFSSIFFIDRFGNVLEEQKEVSEWNGDQRREGEGFYFFHSFKGFQALDDLFCLKHK